jgi:hypothetical protein
MKRTQFCVALIFACLLLPLGSKIAAAQRESAAPQAVSLHWSFDAQTDEALQQAMAQSGDDLQGLWRLVPGVRGRALEFDGYTTSLSREAKNVPALGNAFTVSAWVALDNYPWNWLPLVDQSQFQQVGFSLQVDAFGHVRFGASIDGVWKQTVTESTLPLKKWAHVTGIFRGDSGLTILIDGKPAAHLETPGTFWQATKEPLMIGRVRQPQNSFPAWISHPQDLIEYSLEGDLDEVELLGRAISSDEDREQVAAVPMHASDALPYAVLPSGPQGKGRFGAMYATLSFSPAWDRLRRLGPDSDVVVRFDDSAMRLVFWQGTNYIPAWVTENGKWYTDEFLETWGAGCGGAADCEPMSDKQSRYSHVSVLTSSDARAIVHWRYALAEARNYEGAHADPLSGWFDWADEYWTVYPDGVAVRKQVLWSSSLESPHEWQETIVINGPGQRPEDNIEPDALTLENMAGEAKTYHWEPKTDHTFAKPKGPAKLDPPKDANIQIVHLKSIQNPFQIVQPGGVSFDSYGGEPSYSMFEWWNHWPVAQVGSSGRPAIAADRPSHSSLSHIYWQPYAKTPDSMTKLLLCGLVQRDSAEASLLQLAKSWTSPPQATLRGHGSEALVYDPSQRAFLVHGSVESAESPLDIRIDSSSDRPLVNPAFVIDGWSTTARVSITIAGRRADVPLRQGTEHHLDGEKTVIYLKLTATRPVEVKIEPAAESPRQRSNVMP